MVYPLKYLLVYLDYFTMKINLVPLELKSTEEIYEWLLDMFCDSGPPHIFHSDNGSEFSNDLLSTTLATKWLQYKIDHVKHSDPESQGPVEAYRNIKDCLFGMITITTIILSGWST